MEALNRIGRFGLATAGLAMIALLSALSTLQPIVGIALIGATIGFALAYRSSAIPLGVTSVILFYVVIGARLPQGGTTALVTLWLLLGIVLALARIDTERASVRLAIDGGAIALAILARPGRGRHGVEPRAGLRRRQDAAVRRRGARPVRRRAGRGAQPPEPLLFFRIYAYGGVLTSVYGVWLLLAGGAVEANQNRFTIAQQVNPIGFARSMGETLVILIVLLVDARTTRTRVFLALSAIPVVIAMLGAGSRGPTIGLVAAFAALIAVRRGSGPAFRRLVGTLLAMLALGAVAVALVVPAQTAGRALSIFTGRTSRATRPPASSCGARRSTTCRRARGASSPGSAPDRSRRSRRTRTTRTTSCWRCFSSRAWPGSSP